MNRFTGRYANGSKHIYSPTKILHVSNLEETVTEEVRGGRCLMAASDILTFG